MIYTRGHVAPPGPRPFMDEVRVGTLSGGSYDILFEATNISGTVLDDPGSYHELVKNCEFLSTLTQR